MANNELAVITCGHIIRGERGINFVSRAGGDTCLLCGDKAHESTDGIEDMLVVGLGCLIARG